MRRFHLFRLYTKLAVKGAKRSEKLRIINLNIDPPMTECCGPIDYRISLLYKCLVLFSFQTNDFGKPQRMVRPPLAVGP